MASSHHLRIAASDDEPAAQATRTVRRREWMSAILASVRGKRRRLRGHVQFVSSFPSRFSIASMTYRTSVFVVPRIASLTRWLTAGEHFCMRGSRG